MSDRLDPFWDKYIRLTHRRDEIRRLGKGQTFCSNCYKEATRTAENEGYSGCCNELIVGQEDVIDQISEEVRQVLDDLDRELDHEPNDRDPK